MPSIVRSRVGLLISTLLLLTAIVGLVGWWYVRFLATEISDLHTQNLQASIQLANTRNTFWGLRSVLSHYLMQDAKSRPEIRASNARSVQEVESYLKTYAALPISPKERELLTKLQDSFSAYVRATPRYFELVDAGKVAEAREHSARELAPHTTQSINTLAELIRTQQEIGGEHARRAGEAANTATWLMPSLVLAALVLGAVLSRALTLHIAETVQGVRRSSGELESTASSLLQGAQDMSAATARISASLQELLAHSRQISQTAQNVVSVARETGEQSQSGDVLVKRAQEGFTLIRSTVDEIVRRMVNLSNSSQRIGGILEFVCDLSEQTNILSINAAIEASVAGEAGQRFGALAEEIRRLADRVSNSTREIRSLIEEIRTAADTTVATTESGARAIEASTQQFAEALETFQQITGRVSDTTEAAHQIEQSTRQQVSSVEQVSASMDDLAITAQQTADSSQQTLRACGQLSQISSRLAEFAGAHGGPVQTTAPGP